MATDSLDRSFSWVDRELGRGCGGNGRYSGTAGGGRKQAAWRGDLFGLSGEVRDFVGVGSSKANQLIARQGSGAGITV